MAIPPQVLQMIDQLSEEICSFYIEAARASGAPAADGVGTQLMSRLLARYLLKQGWRPGGDSRYLPVCAGGVPLCFDPGSHEHTARD